MLTLYLAPGSSSMAPHIALHEVGAPFEARPLSFARKENRYPAYLAINPEGEVPTLLVDGRPLTEVAGILFYLARRFPEAGLLPDGGNDEAEAQVVSWMSFLAATVHPARRQGLERARAAWAIVEKRLGGREWAVGGRVSVADIHLFRLFWRFRGSASLALGEFPGCLPTTTACWPGPRCGRQSRPRRRSATNSRPEAGPHRPARAARAGSGLPAPTGSGQVVQPLAQRRRDLEGGELHLQAGSLGCAAHRPDEAGRRLGEGRETHQGPPRPVR